MSGGLVSLVPLHGVSLKFIYYHSFQAKAIRSRPPLTTYLRQKRRVHCSINILVACHNHLTRNWCLPKEPNTEWLSFVQSVNSVVRHSPSTCILGMTNWMPVQTQDLLGSATLVQHQFYRIITCIHWCKAWEISSSWQGANFSFSEQINGAVAPGRLVGTIFLSMSRVTACMSFHSSLDAQCVSHYFQRWMMNSKIYHLSYQSMEN